MALGMVSALGGTGSIGLSPTGFSAGRRGPSAPSLLLGRSAMLPLGREKPAGGVSQRKRETKNSSPGEQAHFPSPVL